MIKKQNSLYYFNKFDDWSEAERYCESIDEGYASEHILKAVARAHDEVRKGNALYEQDGIAYTKEHNNYELLFALFYVYSIEKCLRICDFGGSLGSTYQRYKRVLPQNTEWSVVEQGNYVDYGKTNIGEIDFYYSLEECTDNKNINVILFSGSIQYLPDATKYLSKAAGIVPYILIDETPFFRDDVSETIYIQHVPAEFYGKETYYPCRIFNRNNFIARFNSMGFEKKFEWLYEGIGTGIPILNGDHMTETVDRGFLMVKE